MSKLFAAIMLIGLALIAIAIKDTGQLGYAVKREVR